MDLLRAQAPAWIDRTEEMGWDKDGCALHDAVAAACLVDDTLFKTQEAGVEVELADPALRGITRFSPAGTRKHVVQVITDLDAPGSSDVIGPYLSQSIGRAHATM